MDSNLFRKYPKVSHFERIKQQNRESTARSRAKKRKMHDAGEQPISRNNIEPDLKTSQQATQPLDSFNTVSPRAASEELQIEAPVEPSYVCATATTQLQMAETLYSFATMTASVTLNTSSLTSEPNIHDHNPQTQICQTLSFFKNSSWKLLFFNHKILLLFDDNFGNCSKV